MSPLEARALRLFRRRQDTMQIADALGVSEAEAYRLLVSAREWLWRQPLYDVTARVCGDPPEGRSALDRREG